MSNPLPQQILGIAGAFQTSGRGRTMGAITDIFPPAERFNERSNNEKASHVVWKAICGAEGDRTPDLVNAIHALSQLSYSPVSILMRETSD